MMLKTIACTGLVLVGAATLAVQAFQAGDKERSDDRSVVLTGHTKSSDLPAGFDPLRAAPEGGLVAKEPLKPTIRIERPTNALDRLVVKFGNAWKARAQADGSVISATGFSAARIDELQRKHGVSFSPAIDMESARLDALLAKAAARSGNMQSDLGGMMYVTAPSQSELQATLEKLVSMDIVEYAYWDHDPIPAGGAAGAPGPGGACCLLDAAGCADVASGDDCPPEVGRFFPGGVCAADGPCGACCTDGITGPTCLDNVLATSCADPGDIHFPAFECSNDDGDSICSGACCAPDGSCTETAFDDCVDDWTPYIDCDPIPCEPPAAEGACCFPPFAGFNCAPATQADCIAGGGAYWGDDVSCTFGDDNDELTCDELDAECGSPQFGSCANPDGTVTAFCTTDPTVSAGGPLGPDPPDAPFPPPGDGGVCCEIVCDIAPHCCDTTWDYICASIANEITPVICAGGTCAGHHKLGCYWPHGGPGCSDSACCGLITFINPGCAGSWTLDCVEMAIESCGEGTGFAATTPDFSVAEIYQSSASLDVSDLPDYIGDSIPVYSDPAFVPAVDTIAFGFDGAGWDLYRGGEPFSDFGVDGVAGTGDEGEGDNWFQEGEPWDDFGADGVDGTGDAGEGNGRWDQQQGFYAFGEQMLYEFNMNNYGDNEGDEIVTDPENFVRGRTITVAVIDRSFWADHEDLNVTPEAGQTMVTIDEITTPDHGTAVCGILGALHNDFGTNGMLPYADITFFPLTSVESGAREASAWLNAIESLGPGDIICAPYTPGGVSTVGTVAATWEFIRLASDLGITVVAAAGNAAGNLDDADDLGQHGAIIVGACSPGTPHYRLDWAWGTAEDPTAGSNYNVTIDTTLVRGNYIHTKGWGTNVATTGYGGMFAPDDGLGGGPDPLRSYTPTFGGTSAACAQVAAIVASTQGLTKQMYGLTLNSAQIMLIMGLDGYFQSNLIPFFGENVLGQELNAEAWSIGPWLDLHGSANSIGANLLTLDEALFDGSEHLKEIYVLRGERTFGSIFSVKSDDQSYLIARSQHTPRDTVPGSGPGGASLPEYLIPIVDKLTYLADGQITDVLLVAEFETTDLTQLNFTANVIPPLGSSLNVFEMYDWRARQWTYVHFEVLGEHAGGEETFPTGNDPVDIPGATRYVRESDGKVLFRYWNLGFGGQGQGGAFGGVENDEFLMRYDLLDVNFGSDGPIFGQGGGGIGG